MAEPGERKIISLASMKAACGNCSLQQLCLPIGIAVEDIDRLDAIVRRRRPMSRGSHVFHMGDHFDALFAIRSGSVKTYTLSDDGTEQVTGFHLTGEIIGLDAINTGRHPCAAKVLETTSVCEIPFEQLENLSVEVPALGRQLLRVMSREIQADDALMLLLGKKSADERLAALLVSLSRRYKERGFSASEFQLTMSRNDIGNYLGLAVETVSRLFTRFQEQGLIGVNHRQVKLLQTDRLRELAGVQSLTEKPQRRA